MISREELDNEIVTLENEQPTYAVMQKLSALYSIRDHMGEKKVEVEHTTVSTGGSEFLDAIAGKDMSFVLGVMDELVEALQLINPRLYEGVMDQIKS